MSKLFLPSSLTPKNDAPLERGSRKASPWLKCYPGFSLAQHTSLSLSLTTKQNSFTLPVLLSHLLGLTPYIIFFVLVHFAFALLDSFNETNFVIFLRFRFDVGWNVRGTKFIGLLIQSDYYKSLISEEQCSF